MTKQKKPRRLSLAQQNAKIENISIMGVTERMGPLGLHLYAKAYHDAARALPLPNVPFEPVRPFLVCHSIELALKAFLSLHGAAMLELAEGSYGHNLEAILQKADEKHLGKHVALTNAHKAEIRKAALYYRGKVFEYPAVGEALSAYPSMPVIETLFEVATILVDSLRKLCEEAK
jgi:hypothetical protein